MCDLLTDFRQLKYCMTVDEDFMYETIFLRCICHFQRDITKKLGSPKQPSNPFLEMVKFLLERIAPVHIDTESIRYCVVGINPKISALTAHTHQ